MTRGFAARPSAGLGRGAFDAGGCAPPSRWRAAATPGGDRRHRRSAWVRPRPWRRRARAGLNADRLVLVAPAVWGWSALPAPYALTLWVGAHTFPWRAVSAPRNVARRITASDNREALLRAGRDAHMIWETRIDAVFGLVNLMQRATERSAALDGDVLFLYGANDQIIPPDAALPRPAACSSTARTAYYENGYH